MAEHVEDAMGPLREALRRPDRRTWRRFLPPARGAHRVEPVEGARSDDPPRLLLAVAASGEDAGPLRPQLWQVVAGVLILAAGIVLGTGYLPVDAPPASDGASGASVAADQPTPPDTDVRSTEATTPTTTAVRVWPAERVAVEGRTVRTDAGRWEVGVEGDVVTVGDWDCDRLPTPAVLRPSDGRVAVFDRWAPADAAEHARPLGTVPEAVSVAPGTTCGEISIRTAAGAERILSTHRPAAAGS